MELYTADPVNVTLTTHDKVTIGDRPKFPSCVITASSDDVLLWVVAEGSHSHQVSLEGLGELQVGARWLKLFVKSWVESIVLGDRGRLVRFVQESSGSR